MEGGNLYNNIYIIESKWLLLALKPRKEVKLDEHLSMVRASETLFLIDSKVKFKSAFLFPTGFQMSSYYFDLNFGGDG